MNDLISFAQHIGPIPSIIMLGIATTVGLRVLKFAARMFLAGCLVLMALHVIASVI